MWTRFLRFDPILYPLWRRALPQWLKPLAEPFFQSQYPVGADVRPPDTVAEMARFLVDWQLINDSDLNSIVSALETVNPAIEIVDLDAQPILHDGSRVRVPAQWEPIERVLVSWGRMFPAVWSMHAEMVEAISIVAKVEILLPSPLWARAVALYLQSRDTANFANLHFLILETDDMWIRDYGAIIGKDAHGQNVAVNPIYDVLPQYPQASDNGMTDRWATHHRMPVQALKLHTEGGNLWSDGAGTFILTSQIFNSNPYHSRETLIPYLQSVFDVNKIIITPRMTFEDTGHIDLLLKLVDAQTVFVCDDDSFSTAEALRKTRRLLERERNANGDPYQVKLLPTPPLYMNWGIYPIRRSYANALTVNGRVLVPIYNLATDEIALQAYTDAMPDYEIIPIDSTIAINGGGTVHCMTREIFAS